MGSLPPPKPTTDEIGRIRDMMKRPSALWTDAEKCLAYKVHKSIVENRLAHLEPVRGDLRNHCDGITEWFKYCASTHGASTDEGTSESQTVSDPCHDDTPDS